MGRDTIDADERRFVDERGSSAALAPNGLNPSTIMEKAVRDRIIDSYFYKEQCFALNEADIVDRVVEHVSFVGGTYGSSQKPTPFICLAFKLLQLAPSDDVLAEYLNLGGEEFKYLRALACFYVRLTRRAQDVHKMVEPFLEDYRKLRRKGRAGTTMTHMDEFVDDLLCKDRVCGTSLWKMPKREVLEDLDLLEPRSTSDVEAMLEEDDEAEEEDEKEGKREDGSGSEGEVEERSDVDMDRGERLKIEAQDEIVAQDGIGAEVETGALERLPTPCTQRQTPSYSTGVLSPFSKTVVGPGLS
ncbi:related to pre-mRNA-splicing factor 38A [Cephalotrichum gorgonifer]|uniref:Pre-mRNA-splicing factor 38 n=1 Tax=Cephalotrichum gorgonifer TaxID=2041049 RepID=A0AAE8MUL1_9PEZI|nr:related to pre-mRNA-splicing factor 38A [Cephalotrichum gorgonifer]